MRFGTGMTLVNSLQSAANDDERDAEAEDVQAARTPVAEQQRPGLEPVQVSRTLA